MLPGIYHEILIQKVLLVPYHANQDIIKHLFQLHRVKALQVYFSFGSLVVFKTLNHVLLSLGNILTTEGITAGFF